MRQVSILSPESETTKLETWEMQISKNRRTCLEILEERKRMEKQRSLGDVQLPELSSCRECSGPFFMTLLETWHMQVGVCGQNMANK